ncbi:MAG: hypothetical protein RLZZ601_2061 [Pseudomonadota bacterium]
MKEKNVYSRSLQTDFEMVRSMNAEPEHEDANSNSKCYESCKALLKPN